MKKIFFVIFIILILIAGIFYYFSKTIPSKEKYFNEEKRSEKTILSKRSMRLESPVFENNGFIPSKYTCDGDNINPPLKISDVPESAKSLVLIVDDPDAPSGTWVHWTIWNIPPRIQELQEASLPQGAVEGLTDFGKLGYGGPCPPSGVHRYFFKLYALDKFLELDSSARVQDIEKAMEGHILEKTQLIGLYQHQ